jgi:hypothetical protein
MYGITVQIKDSTSKFPHFSFPHPIKKVCERETRTSTFSFCQYNIGGTSSLVLELRKNQKGANLQNTIRNSKTLRLIST